VKNLNFAEFQTYIAWCESLLIGAQLQGVWTNDLSIVFEFYKFQNIWLVVDLDVSHPQIVLIQQKSPPLQKKPKPVGLFISSHAKNLRVKTLKSVPELGRVARLELDTLVEGEARNCLIEMQMVPRNPNVLVMTKEVVGEGKKTKIETKKISWHRLLELPRVEVEPQPLLEGKESEWLDREDEWWQSQRGSSKKNQDQNLVQKTTAEKSTEKIIEKKQKAVLALEATLASTDDEDLRSYGQLLLAQESVPDKYLKFQKLSANDAFEKAKLIRRKRQGTHERIAILQQEIERLRQQPNAVLAPTSKSAGNKTMQKAQARGRKLELGDGLEAVCGKSAKDNLAILRQARGWDLWMHLKDYPGAHGIIFCKRNQEVSTEVLQKVAEWVIAESPAARGFSWGAKYEVVVVECRFVRPIKGDGLGRVTYQNPRVYTFASNKKS
jgi:predicted ribosome quality control (RQC) complex YloA/Tae2 family protein